MDFEKAYGKVDGEALCPVLEIFREATYVSVAMRSSAKQAVLVLV